MAMGESVRETEVVVPEFTITVVELLRYDDFLILIWCDPAVTSDTVIGVTPINCESR